MIYLMVPFPMTLSDR